MSSGQGDKIAKSGMSAQSTESSLGSASLLEPFVAVTVSRLKCQSPRRFLNLRGATFNPGSCSQVKTTSSTSSGGGAEHTSIDPIPPVVGPNGKHEWLLGHCYIEVMTEIGSRMV